MNILLTELKRSRLYSEELGIGLNRPNPKTLTFCRIEVGLIRQRTQLSKQRGG